MKYLGTDPRAVTEFDDDKLQANIALLGFKTAVNGSLAKYNLVDQIIDEYTDATGVDTSASTNETLDACVYSGKATTGTAGETISATGGVGGLISSADGGTGGTGGTGTGGSAQGTGGNGGAGGSSGTAGNYGTCGGAGDGNSGRVLPELQILEAVAEVLE